MSLPPEVLQFLNEAARRAGVANPEHTDDLFRLGILDSFSLVEFVTVLEEHCLIKVPDEQVLAENFKTIEEIERVVNEHKRSKE